MANELSLPTRVLKGLLSMIGIRDSEQKMRENAANWLELAEKVWHYRRDRLSTSEVTELMARTAELRQRLKENVGAAKLKLHIESLEGVLRKVGGGIYPKTALVENVEFFLVAAIVILGIRTYFVQPFKIPTNSMWPTYYGMTAENFPPGAEAPGGLQRVFRLLAFGAQRREILAPRSGEISALFFDDGRMVGTPRNGRKWLVLPAAMTEYTFLVDGEPATLQVPADFHDFEQVVKETYFGSESAFVTEWERQGRQVNGHEHTMMHYDDAHPMIRVVRMPLGKTAKTGEPILRFDLMTGDQLFVDRVSYHFVPPKVGQGFVFRTGNIPDIARDYGDQYYIKRLVGVPGDTLQVREPFLWRNGKLIEGADAFRKNGAREAPYGGYINEPASRGARFLLTPEETLKVPPHKFFAMGDNSAKSADSRYWGFVPARDVAGRPLFIYYPFTRRWGPAR